MARQSSFKKENFSFEMSLQGVKFETIVAMSTILGFIKSTVEAERWHILANASFLRLSNPGSNLGSDKSFSVIYFVGFEFKSVGC
jgi:hypothetical protein